MITSNSSPRFKYFDQLKQKKNRIKMNLFLVEGIHLVEEALKSNAIDRVIYTARVRSNAEGSALLDKLRSKDIVCEEATDPVINELSNVETPQGIIAAVKPGDCDIGNLFDSPDPIIVIACGIQDPGNLGTIIRTADAAGCAGVIAASGTVDPYNDKAVRSSAGSIFHLNIIINDDIINLVSSLKRRGIKMIGTSTDAAKKYYEMDLKGPVALIIGNEGQGLPEDVIRVCDDLVLIPMAGRVESLNAAVSAAIVIFEAVKQRMSNAGKAN